MKNSSVIFLSLLSAALLSLGWVSLACAQDTGFYVKADMGGGVTMDTDLKSFFGPVSSGSEVKFEPGLRFGVAAGYQLTDWFALEAEIGGMYTEIDEITDATYLDAWFSSVPFLANARFQYRNASPLTPYIGAGMVYIDSKPQGALADGTLPGGVALDDEKLWQPRYFGGLKLTPFPLFSITGEVEYAERPAYSLKAAINF